MLPVRNMLTESKIQEQQSLPRRRPSVLDISSLLCTNDEPIIHAPKPRNYHRQPYTTHPPSLHHSYTTNSVPEENTHQRLMHWKPIHRYQPEQQPHRYRIRRYDTITTEQPHTSASTTSTSLRSLSKYVHNSRPTLHTKESNEELQSDSRLSFSPPSSPSSSSSSVSKHARPQEDKVKRRRATQKQLDVLNSVFERTIFPSTQLRAELGRQLDMSPRTVQIWFQNKRQSMRTRENSTSSPE